MRLQDHAKIATLCMALLPSSAMADLVAPTEEVILMVSGQISETNVGDTAEFDREMLESLPRSEFETSTIWTERRHTFTGVALVDLLEALGAEGTEIEATAINDYAVTLPLTDAVQGGPIVAYEIDGEAMSVRDKGPLWIVYPYDDEADYRSETIYSRSIWQLDRLHVKD